MKTLAAILMLFAVSAATGDLTGTWSGTFKVDGADHDIPQRIILERNGNELIGSGGPDAQEQYPIENGRIDGERVRFEITTGEWKFSYDLKQTPPDSLNGTLELKSISETRAAKVSLSKTKPE
jgi:hypothetical protein